MLKIQDAVPELSAAILHLPTEILLLIFHQAYRLDRLCLALTCKRLLQVSSLLPLHIPSVPRHRLHVSTPATPCIGMVTLLRRLKLLGRTGRAKKTVALCCDCLRYRPTRKGFWNKDAKGLQEVGSMYAWEAKVASWNRRSSLQCPACHCDERTVGVKRYNGAYKRMTQMTARPQREVLQAGT